MRAAAPLLALLCLLAQARAGEERGAGAGSGSVGPARTQALDTSWRAAAAASGAPEAAAAPDWSPLHDAAFSGDVEALQRALEARAPPPRPGAGACAAAPALPTHPPRPVACAHAAHAASAAPRRVLPALA
jgi:hypothetical protein